MSNSDPSVVIYVSYQGAPESRFDRDHYVNEHLPLVMRSWQRYGLISATAFFPAIDQAGTIAICECVFRDEAAVQAAFVSAETSAVMADVPRFTDLTPDRSRATRL
ncbi:EthD family reductase [Sodalis sp. RH15]|uniref:EthD family reductase n=1 Tax=Sodalis sp. RH15 TaxID=3394330 RepID=UPI0039B4027E